MQNASLANDCSGLGSLSFIYFFVPQLKRYLVLVFLVPQLKGGANQRLSPRYQVDQLPVFALIFVEDNLSQIE